MISLYEITYLVAHMETYALGAFPKNGGVDKCIRSLKLLFGARHFDGYHAMSLKEGNLEGNLWP